MTDIFRNYTEKKISSTNVCRGSYAKTMIVDKLTSKDG